MVLQNAYCAEISRNNDTCDKSKHCMNFKRHHPAYSCSCARLKRKIRGTNNKNKS